MEYFHDHELIGGFKITRQLTCAPSHELPIFIPENLDVREDLANGFAEALKINDYEERKEPKQKFFLEWLINQNFHRGVLEKKYNKPSFICFGGRITEPLSTKAFWKSSDVKWEIYAAKFNDAIYLYKNDGHNSNDGRDFGNPSPYYYNSRFRHLLTTIDPDAAVVNEYDKLQSIHQVTFGTHQILNLNVFLDAKTAKGELMAFQTFAPPPEKKPSRRGKPCVINNGFYKSLRYWTQCKVCGVPNVVLGERHGESSVLKDAHFITTDDLPTPWNWQTQNMYNFLDRFLTKITNELDQNDPRIVRKFSWKDGDVKVEPVAEADIPALMLPDWYTQAVQKQVEAAN